MPTKLTTEQRFWAKVDTSAGPGTCWLWMASRNNNGYGQFFADGRLVLSHRYSYELQIGPIPPGLFIDHLCRTRAGQNPRHMEPVTNAENVRRGVTGQKAAARASCPQGHPYSGDNLYVRASRSRDCRTCKREYMQRRAREKRELIEVLS